MRRDVVIEVSSRGMIKTGLKSDICQVCLVNHQYEDKENNQPLGLVARQHASHL